MNLMKTQYDRKNVQTKKRFKMQNFFFIFLRKVMLDIIKMIPKPCINIDLLITVKGQGVKKIIDT